MVTPPFYDHYPILLILDAIALAKGSEENVSKRFAIQSIVSELKGFHRRVTNERSPGGYKILSAHNTVRSKS
jgi:hypothetical protein